MLYISASEVSIQSSASPRVLRGGGSPVGASYGPRDAASHKVSSRSAFCESVTWTLAAIAPLHFGIIHIALTVLESLHVVSLSHTDLLLQSICASKYCYHRTQTTRLSSARPFHETPVVHPVSSFAPSPDWPYGSSSFNRSVFELQMTFNPGCAAFYPPCPTPCIARSGCGADLRPVGCAGYARDASPVHLPIVANGTYSSTVASRPTCGTFAACTVHGDRGQDAIALQRPVCFRAYCDFAEAGSSVRRSSFVPGLRWGADTHTGSRWSPALGVHRYLSPRPSVAFQNTGTDTYARAKCWSPRPSTTAWYLQALYDSDADPAPLHQKPFRHPPKDLHTLLPLTKRDIRSLPCGRRRCAMCALAPSPGWFSVQDCTGTHAREGRHGDGGWSRHGVGGTACGAACLDALTWKR
ncbi:hypothetical protein MSAN_02109600 [Mycena sanguinolenta]|uniref:Uncharacterized protein n=1 Tax=Mycena sanguinolenta TaxID=230812 RepID=A0A8H6XI60_9AGAR|nr:hypothetical protein MSAN_02109600 [Mycena sanguinolenta]